ncbi:MAG: cytidylate kinase [Candidatus Wolframiiraptor sp. EX4484-121]|nr:MAG: cytidylate kinase [Candidatus Wolframiiraptor sp. EX4484-121]
MAEKIVICVSGLAATGKSTLARRLAESLNLRYISGGDGLKMLAVEKGYRPGGREWWETEEGMRFLEERLKNPEFDKLVDQKLIELAKAGDVVIDSWVLPWLYRGGFNIWLKAKVEVRAERMARRSGISVEEARRLLEKRDSESIELYRRLYGIEVGRDFEPFHLILDTSDLDEPAVYRIVLQAVKEFFRLG